MMFFFSYEPDREGMLEKSSVARDFPIGKAVYSFMQDFVPSSSSFPGRNTGRFTCQCSQLKSIMSGTESFSDGTAKDEHQIPMRVVTTTRPIPEQELNS
ncbi:pentatricopeptide repeat-containing protein [Populus alba x Populus x berolinensis]|nr:pentatricopeptide repeat-containing protein [Populus alba x Populus x berolinensis]